MESWKKIILGTVAGTALIGGTVYALRLNKMSAELEIVPIGSIHQFDSSGLTLRVDVQLKNPTRTAFKIKFPFIKLLYKGNSVGSSQVIDKDILIPAFGEAVVNKIMIRIPLLSVFSLSGSLLKSIQNKEAVKVDVQTLTTIDLGWKKFPYTNSKTITLKTSKA